MPARCVTHLKNSLPPGSLFCLLLLQDLPGPLLCIPRKCLQQQKNLSSRLLAVCTRSIHPAPLLHMI